MIFINLMALMATTLKIFDRALLSLRRSRIASSAGKADFLHESIAIDMADRLSVIKRDFPIAVDLGTHTGRIAEMLRQQPNIGVIMQMDACLQMLQRHAKFSRRPAICADEELLPFAPNSLDLVCSSLALHFVNDLPGTMIQIFRALRPDGLFMGALFGSGTLKELGQSFLEAETEITGGISPHIVPLADVREMGSLLQRAGFTLPVADVETVTVRYDSPMGLIRDLRQMGATNILAERSRRPVSRATLARMLEIYGEKFSDPDGRIRATFEIIHIAGWHPHESQQKPLAPGSAEMKLADALGSRTND